MENNIKIFVVNLKESEVRRKMMEQQLKKLNLPYEIFEAIKGSDLSQEEILNYYDEDYYNSRPAYYSNGMVGCTLTHYFIYKKIVEEQIEIALILEDDMALNPELNRILESLSSKTRKDEAVLLFYQSYSPIKLSKLSEEQLTHNYNLYQVTDLKGLISTAAYVITQQAAQKMLKGLSPISNTPDDWKKFYDRQMLNGVRVIYPFLLQNTYQKTTINPNLKGGYFIQSLLAFIEKTKVFPFYYLLKRRRKLNTAKTRQCFLVNEPTIDFREN